MSERMLIQISNSYNFSIIIDQNIFFKIKIEGGNIVNKTSIGSIGRPGNVIDHTTFIIF